MTDFISEAINHQLEKLRLECAVHRLHVRNAYRPILSNKLDQAAAMEERPKELEKRLQALAQFIAEHRQFMGPDWPGTDHGRLCWADFMGGTPIRQHYCIRPEGHAGVCADEYGGWPKGVTNEYEWHKLTQSCPHPKRGTSPAGVAICGVCGAPI